MTKRGTAAVTASEVARAAEADFEEALESDLEEYD